MEVHLLRLLALGLGAVGVVAAAVALLVPEVRLRRWSLIAFGFAAAAAVAHVAARRYGPPSLFTHLAALAAMIGFVAPAARWVWSALDDASSD